MTLVYAPELYVPKRDRRYTKARDQFLREHVGVDPALLALELGLSVRFVIDYQRKIGVRKCACNNPKKAQDADPSHTAQRRQVGG